METEIEDPLDWIFASVSRTYSIDYLRLEGEYSLLEVVKLWAINAHHNAIEYEPV